MSSLHCILRILTVFVLQFQRLLDEKNLNFHCNFDRGCSANSFIAPWSWSLCWNNCNVCHLSFGHGARKIDCTGITLKFSLVNLYIQSWCGSCSSACKIHFLLYFHLICRQRPLLINTEECFMLCQLCLVRKAHVLYTGDGFLLLLVS